VVAPDAQSLVERQAALEARAAGLWPLVEQGQLDVAVALGEMEDWRLDVDGHELLLVPSTREWFWHDPIHDSWDPTGYRAGEVVFARDHVFDRARPVRPTP